MMKNYDRFVMNSMRPTVTNTSNDIFTGFFNRIMKMIARMFNRSD